MLLFAIQMLGVGGSPTDGELMQRLVRREERALELLYNRYSRVVYSLVLRITGQAAPAQEVVQEVFLQLWKKAESYQSAKGALEPWLLTLARHRALDHVRGKAEKQRQHEDGTDDFATTPLPAATPDPEQMIDQKRRAELIRKVMATLSDAQRKALELAYFEGMSHTEIAAHMNEPLGTVKTWIRSALLQLRQQLGEAQ